MDSRKIQFTLMKSAFSKPIQKVFGFNRKVNVHFRARGFTVKTLNTKAEWVQALRLRYDIFHKEYIGNVFPLGFDKDRFDQFADILIIKDNATNKVVGTYRMICSQFSSEFYSADEFELNSFFQEPGVKLELSRACVHPAYRNGVVISLMWRGIVHYLKAVKADYLFGCSSVRTTDPDEIEYLSQYLAKNQRSALRYSILPTKKYEPPKIQREFEFADKSFCDKVENKIPPLLRAYMNAGARVSTSPALDKKYRCIDFLTVLKVSEMSSMHGRRYACS